jgi:hypothetical protein
MAKWHETFAAQVGLRLGGATALLGAWLTCSFLYTLVHSHPPRQASLSELGLCALLVMLGIVGSALLRVGPGLWKQVERPAWRSAALFETHEIDPLSHRAFVALRRQEVAVKAPERLPIGASSRKRIDFALEIAQG